MFFLLYKCTDKGIFDDFPKISQEFPKLSQRPDERSQTFSENFRKFPKMSEDFRRFPKISEDFQRFPIYLWVFQKVEIALAEAAHAISAFLKNSCVQINSKLNLKPIHDYLYKFFPVNRIYIHTQPNLQTNV